MNATNLLSHLESAPKQYFWNADNISIAEHTHEISIGADQGIAIKNSELSPDKFIREEVLGPHGVGFCVFNLKDANLLNDEVLITAFHQIIPHFGRLHSQNAKGDVFYRVEQVAVPKSGNHRLSMFNKATTMHSDCTYGDDRPSIISLSCVREAENGGVSLLSSLYTALKNLTDTPLSESVLHELLGDFYYDRRGSQINIADAPAGRYPMIKVSDGHLNVRYKRPYMESGHDCMNTPMSMQKQKALNAFEEIINSPEITAKYLLKRGEILIANNEWLLHDREPFSDLENKPGRLLIRNWISAR